MSMMLTRYQGQHHHHLHAAVAAGLGGLAPQLVLCRSNRSLTSLLSRGAMLWGLAGREGPRGRPLHVCW